jgi:hypothetical protein
VAQRARRSALCKAGLDLEKDIEWVRGMFHPVHVPVLRSGKVECIPCKPWDAEKLLEEGCNVPPINDVCAQDLVAEAYKELMERQDLKEEYGRVAAIAQKWGY